VDTTNLYAYVGGNPVNAVDPQGTYMANVIGGVLGAVSGGAGSCLDGCDLTDILIGAGTGLVAGAISPSAIRPTDVCAIHTIGPLTLYKQILLSASSTFVHKIFIYLKHSFCSLAEASFFAQGGDNEAGDKIHIIFFVVECGICQRFSSYSFIYI